MKNDLFENPQLVAQFTEEAIYECVPQVWRTHDRRLRMNCPICGETTGKRRGWFDQNSGGYKCWNGGCEAEAGMTGLWFASHLRQQPYGRTCADFIKWANENGETVSVACKTVAEADVPEELTSSFGNATEKDESLFEDSWVSLPDVVKAYCDQRKLFEAPFRPKNWELFFDVNSKRLVIPWVESGKVIYWQKRQLIFDKDEPKYLYPVGIQKPVFGLDKIDVNFPLIHICEAVIDSIFIYNGIAVGGLSPSPTQLKAIRDRYPGHQPVLVTDNFWVDKSSRQALMGSRRDNRIGLLQKHLTDWKFFVWPRNCGAKDVNESKIADDRSMKFEDKDWLLSRSFNSLQTKILMETGK
jgi:hypothetical protein